MKREKVLEMVKEYGAIFIRHGKKHDIYENPRTHEYAQNRPGRMSNNLLKNAQHLFKNRINCSYKVRIIKKQVPGRLFCWILHAVFCSACPIL